MTEDRDVERWITGEAPPAGDERELSPLASALADLEREPAAELADGETERLYAAILARARRDARRRALVGRTVVLVGTAAAALLVAVADRSIVRPPPPVVRPPDVAPHRVRFVLDTPNGRVRFDLTVPSEQDRGGKGER